MLAVFFSLSLAPTDHGIGCSHLGSCPAWALGLNLSDALAYNEGCNVLSCRVGSWSWVVDYFVE